MFQCTKCDFKSKIQQTLTNHKWTKHFGITYDCDQCDHKAVHRKSLLYHKQTKHQNLMFSCESCDYESKEKASLVQHIRAKHLGVRYNCDQCPFKTVQKKKVKMHKQLVHEIKPKLNPGEKKPKIDADEIKSNQDTGEIKPKSEAHEKLPKLDKDGIKSDEKPALGRDELYEGKVEKVEFKLKPEPDIPLSTTSSPAVSSTPMASGDDERKRILELLQSVSRTMDRIATPGTPQVDHILDMRDTIEYNYIVHDNKLNQ